MRKDGGKAPSCCPSLAQIVTAKLGTWRATGEKLHKIAGLLIT